MINNRKKIIAYVLFILFVILFLCIAFTQRKHMLEIYEAGKNKISNEQYKEAQEILSELGDYKDSLDLIKSAQVLAQKKELYDKAVELFNSEDYKDAIEIFTQIEEYKDSKKYIDEAEEVLSQKDSNDVLYNDAYNDYKTNNYILAIRKFLELNTYKDSKDMLQECKIQLARLQQATTISAGIRSSVGMIRNGKVYWAGNDEYSWKDELETWNDIISISVKGNFVLGLKEDGTVVMAGKIPEYYVGTKTWIDVIAISSGQQYIIGLRSDGTLVAQGHNGDLQADIDDWIDIVAISTGWRHTVGLDSNGEIHITGLGSKKQLEYIENHKDEWTNIIDIDAGGGTSEDIGATPYTVALKQDKTVVTTLPNVNLDKNNGWSDIIAISAGDSHIVGLKSDGTVVTTETGNSAKEISEWTDIVAISAGYRFTLGLKKDGTVVAAGYDKQGQIDVDSWEGITNYEEEWQSIFDQNLRWNGIKRKKLIPS